MSARSVAVEGDGDGARLRNIRLVDVRGLESDRPRGTVVDAVPSFAWAARNP